MPWMNDAGAVVIGVLAALATFGAPRVVQAAPTPEQCIQAFHDTQSLRRDGKLLSARDNAVVCGQDACPAPLGTQCARWLGEIDASTPTVVFGAQDELGADLVDVKVVLDGAVAAQRLDGKSMAIDPGVHTLRFFDTKGREAQKEIVVRQGEKDRRVVVVLARTPSADDAESGIIQLELRLSRSPMSLSDTRFSASGFDAAGYSRGFAAVGSDLGLHRPTLWLVDMAMDLRTAISRSAQWSFAVFVGGGTGRRDGVPGSTEAETHFDASSVSAARFGASIGVGYLRHPVWIHGELVGAAGYVWIASRDLWQAGDSSMARAAATHGWVAPRAGVDFLLPYRFTFGVAVAENLLHLGDTEITMAIGIRLQDTVLDTL